VHEQQLPETGVELSGLTPSRTPISSERGAKCGALDDKDDPELAKLVNLFYA